MFTHRFTDTTPQYSATSVFWQMANIGTNVVFSESVTLVYSLLQFVTFPQMMLMCLEKSVEKFDSFVSTIVSSYLYNTFCQMSSAKTYWSHYN